MYFRLIKVNFPFIKGEGKRRKLSFPSTVDNFCPRSTTSGTHFDPHDTHSYALKMITQPKLVMNQAGESTKAVSRLI